MNKRLTVINALGNVAYCVLSPDKNYDKQLLSVFSFAEGQGFSASFTGEWVIVTDYFHGEERARFQVLSLRDTDKEVQYHWTTVKPLFEKMFSSPERLETFLRGQEYAGKRVDALCNLGGTPALIFTEDQVWRITMDREDVILGIYDRVDFECCVKDKVFYINDKESDAVSEPTMIGSRIASVEVGSNLCSMGERWTGIYICLQNGMQICLCPDSFYVKE